MYILKLSAVICVAASLGAGFISAQTFDSDAQNKTREALRQKLAEVDAATTNAATVTAPAVPQAPAIPPTPAIPTAPAAPTVAVPDVQVPTAPAAPSIPAIPATPSVQATTLPAVPATPTVDAAASPAPASLSTDEESKLREAMRQAIATSRNNQPVVTTPAAPAILPAPVAPAIPAVSTDLATVPLAPAAPAVVISPAPSVKAGSASFTVPPAPMTAGQLSADEQDKVTQAMRAQKASLDAKEVQYVPASASTVNKKNIPDSVAFTTKNPYMENAVVAPVAMVPGSKEQKLFDLLQLYKQDRITPAEYHEQRARIVAGQ